MNKLEAGMLANFTVDPSLMPLENLIVLAIFLLAVLLIIIIFIAKYVQKIGPLDIRKSTIQNETQHEMDSEIAGEDRKLIKIIKSIIKRMELRLENLLSDFGICSSTARALVEGISRILEDSAGENHFTTVLMPENRDLYISNLVGTMEDKYKSIYNKLPRVSCINEGKLPPWDTIKDTMQKFIAYMVDNYYCTEVIKTCICKIQIYQKYEPKFASDNFHAVNLVKMIKKNNKYIQQLDRHGKGWPPLEELS